MINRTCSLCGEYVNDVWVYVIGDYKDNKVEFSGHKKCIDDVENKYKEIKDRKKLTLDKIIKQLNLKES